MKLTLGFSPCPNDTYIFDALVNKKIDTEGLDFDVVLEDVETLNRWALEGKLDITKLSFPAFFQSLEKYILLNSGSALGKGVGPMLISKELINNEQEIINSKTIAIPGENTTAHLLFSLAYPSATNKQFTLFSKIEDAVINGEVDCGVIIHENRFTYQSKGLKKIIDLGEYWETQQKVPIPLGGIAIKRNLPHAIIKKVNRLIKSSLEFANKNYPNIPPYVKQHSQEMSEDVMRQHIQLYVNDYSIDLGKDGKEAINVLFNTFKKIRNINREENSTALFID
ncbi:MAG: 1,4-dihydroxy-6-naphthoate synthase [Chitinophagaceae bacterium]|nr:1,4-dihydroxy-6-naphthoate synthase [Chitinophagaceae bacterium]